MCDNIKEHIHTIAKCPTDTKLYRGLVLKNGLTVLLINDSDSAVSSVSLSLSVGSLSDPENVPGLANLCKRMLPLGSKKYPEDFKYFVSNHNGHYLSYVETDHTNFYCDIEHGFLSSLLNRFARFIYEPLFPINQIEREINIIDTEHRTNVSSDISHLTQLKRNLIDENHPLNHFGNGSKETLWKIPKSNGVIVYDYLLAFYSKWYSSHLMYLAVYSKEDLDTLENLVQSIFGNIEKKSVDMPIWCDMIYRDNVLTTKTVVVTKSMKLLNLSFPIFCQKSVYKAMPTKFVKSILEYQSTTSIINILKNKKLATKLTAGNKCVARNINFFEIDVDLTERGVKNVDDVIALIVQGLKVIRQKGIQLRFHEENVNTSKIEFELINQWSPLKYVSTLTPKMIKYKLKRVLIAENIISAWNPVLIDELLLLLSPNNMRVIVASKLVSNMSKNGTTIIDKYYGTRYSTSRILERSIKKWQMNNICYEFIDVPPINIFTAQNFAIAKYRFDDRCDPNVIYESFFLKCWHKKDSEFRIPKIFMSIELLSTIVKNKQLYSESLAIFVKLFNDHFSNYKYYITKAGYVLNILPCNNGIKIQFNGFNDKAKVLMTKIFDELFSFKINPLHFKNIKKETICELKNNKLPYQMAMEYNSSILSDTEWHINELNIIDGIKLVDIENFRRKFFCQIHIETFVYGNVEKNTATELNIIIERSLYKSIISNSILPGRMVRPREVQLKKGESILFKIMNKHHKSSSVFINFQCGIFSIFNGLVVDAFNDLIKMACTKILKNEENIGYIVKSLTKSKHGILYWGIVVESDKNDPEHIHTRIENFIDTIEALLKNISKKSFQEFKSNFKNQLKPPATFEEQALAYELEIVNREYMFDRNSYKIDLLRKLTKNSIVSFYYDYIKKTAPRRSMLAVHVISTLNRNTSYLQRDNGLNNNCTILTDIQEFKKTRGLYPIITLPLSIVPS